MNSGLFQDRPQRIELRRQRVGVVIDRPPQQRDQRPLLVVGEVKHGLGQVRARRARHGFRQRASIGSTTHARPSNVAAVLAHQPLPLAAAEIEHGQLAVAEDSALDRGGAVLVVDEPVRHRLSHAAASNAVLRTAGRRPRR